MTNVDFSHDVQFNFPEVGDESQEETQNGKGGGPFRDGAGDMRGVSLKFIDMYNNYVPNVPIISLSMILQKLHEKYSTRSGLKKNPFCYTIVIRLLYKFVIKSLTCWMFLLRGQKKVIGK